MGLNYYREYLCADAADVRTRILAHHERRRKWFPPPASAVVPVERIYPLPPEPLAPPPPEPPIVKVLPPSAKINGGCITPKAIVREAARTFGVEPGFIMSRERFSRHCNPRWIAIVICHKFVRHISYAALGRFFCMDHTTVRNAVLKCRPAMERINLGTDATVRDWVLALSKEMGLNDGNDLQLGSTGGNRQTENIVVSRGVGVRDYGGDLERV